METLFYRPVVDRTGMEMALDTFRHNLSAHLPGFLDKATNGYRLFINAVDPPVDAKDFATHHAACRAALAHIQLLVSLARWVETTDGSTREGAKDDLDRLIAEAEIALKNRSP
jgi:hypothetical protein